MTLEEQIKEATPLGGTYQHACPGGWTAYAAKNERGGCFVRYVKSADAQYIAAIEKSMGDFISASKRKNT